jgi:hypothetical protein
MHGRRFKVLPSVTGKLPVLAEAETLDATYQFDCYGAAIVRPPAVYQTQDIKVAR